MDKQHENKEGWKSDAKPIPEPKELDSSQVDMSKLLIKKGKKTK